MKTRQPVHDVAQPIAVETLNFAGVDLPKSSARATRSRVVRPAASANLGDKVLKLKREEIIRVAGELFYSRGFTEASLDDITSRLAIGKPQIYTSMAVLFREVKHLPPDAVAELAGNFHSFNRCLGDLLKEGAATGEFSISDASVLTLAIGGMTTWIYSWYRPDGQRTPEEISDQMASLALKMVGAKST
jgi:hypothetical protein